MWRLIQVHKIAMTQTRATDATMANRNSMISARSAACMATTACVSRTDPIFRAPTHFFVIGRPT